MVLGLLCHHSPPFLAKKKKKNFKEKGLHAQDSSPKQNCDNKEETMWNGGRTTRAKDGYNGKTSWWAWSSGGDIACAIGQSRTILLKSKEFFFLG